MLENAQNRTTLMMQMTSNHVFLHYVYKWLIPNNLPIFMQIHLMASSEIFELVKWMYLNPGFDVHSVT